MNIRDIARRARVSTATVSRTLNRASTVDPKLARRVLNVVQRTGFYPNVQARALVSGRSRIFGLIVSEITNPFFPEIVQSFENIAVAHNYEILLSSTVHDPERMRLAVRRMVERRVDGIAVMTFGMEEALATDPQLRRIPLVFVDQSPDDGRSSHIQIDYLFGIRQAVSHLVDLGHERIAFISGPLNLPSAVERRTAFVTALRQLRLKRDRQLVIEGDHTMEGGMAAFSKLCQITDKPTAVVCSNDMTAIGVVRQAYETKLRVPEDISVVGFDDIRFSRFMVPPLTTIQMSQSRLAELAFRALLSSVDPKAEPRSDGHKLRTELIQRRSTAPPASLRARAQSAR